MKAASFAYHSPRTLAEAVSILGEVAQDDGRILAGGQSLVPTMAYRLAAPAHLIDINRINEASFAEVDGDHFSVGCLTRHAAFEKPIVANPLGRMLAEVCSHIAHYPIRRRGTMCGSLAHADPASEWCLTALTLDAEIEARSVDGTRAVAAQDFFQGIMTTQLADNELLARVRFPLLRDDVRFGFFEFSRRAGDFGLTMVLATFRIEHGRIVDPKIGLGGVEECPIRSQAAESVLMGEMPSEALFAAAGEAAAAAVMPMEDIHAPAAYRRHLVKSGVISAMRKAML
jgi:carbon-monoxide dehydrogenase medium subunit